MFFDAIYVITLRDLKRFWREKPRIVGAIMMPVLWLIVVGTGLDAIFKAGTGTYTQYMFPGIIAMTILFTSVFSSTSVIWDKQFGFMKEILVAPVPRTSIALGKALSGSIQAMIQVAIMLMFSPVIKLIIPLSAIFKIFLIAFLVSFSLTSMGLFFASVIESYEGFNVIFNFIVMPMFFFSGALFPIENLPSWLTVIVHFDPLTYGVDLLRGTIMGLNVYPVYIDIAVLLIFTVVMTLLAVSSFNKKM